MDWHARIREALTGAGRAPDDDVRVGLVPDDDVRVGLVPDDDVIEELVQHAVAAFETARAEGLDPHAAEQRVTRWIEQWRGQAPDLRRPRRRPSAPAPPPPAPRFAGIILDVRYAWRILRRQPRFAVVAILTMALGVGPAIALFAIVYGVLVKPLPWPVADRLLVIKETRGGLAPRFGSMSNAAYVAWSENPTTIDALAAWTIRTATLTDGGDADRVRLTAGTASLFRVLAVQPIAGTLFSEADERERVIVIAESLWRQRFGGDPAIVGRTIFLDGEAFVVRGVTADSSAYPDRASRGWVPFPVLPATGNRLIMFEAIAKLRAGITIEQAMAEGTTRGANATDTGPTTFAIFGGQGPIGLTARRLDDTMLGEVRRPLIIVLGAVGLLLVIAMTNVASLQLARASARRREMAVRAAIGADRARVGRQLIIESLVLGAAGSAAGFAVAWGLHAAALLVLPSDFPRVADVTLSGRVIAFGIVSSAVASLACGFVPVLRLRRMNVAACLAEGRSAPAGLGVRTAGARTRLFIVSGQVALACVILVAASLLGRSFLRLLAADRGYDPARVSVSALQMSGPAYTPERRIALVESVLAQLRTRGPRTRVAFTSESPLTPGGSTSSMSIPSANGGPPFQAQMSPRLVSPGYFEALGLRVVSGRVLSDRDTETSEPVAVVNETFARKYLGSLGTAGRIPMGIWGQRVSGSAQVVGVVSDVRYIGAASTSLPEIYFSYRQVPVGLRSTTATLLIADSSGGVTATDLRAIVRALDSNAVVTPLMTFEDRLLATSLARPRLYAALLTMFAAIALAVTGVGLFAAISFTMAQRTGELALRAALGATPRSLVALVLRQGLGAVLVGTIAGLLLARLAARYTSSVLYGVTISDPLTYAIVPLMVLSVATVACVGPAFRAARLDPVDELSVS